MGWSMLDKVLGEQVVNDPGAFSGCFQSNMTLVHFSVPRMEEQ
jgi:hypothetical protein